MGPGRTLPITRISTAPVSPSFNIASIYNVTTNSVAVGSAPAYSAGAPGSYNYRFFPQNLLRQDHENNWDLSLFKGFRMGDWALWQFRIDAFNAFNRPQFSAANVRRVRPRSATSPAFRTLPAPVQGGLHLAF